MTQEEKQLLLKVLCASLPYKPKIYYYYLNRNNIEIEETRKLGLSDIENLEQNNMWRDITVFKPYLRPMSSMTEEEKREYHEIDSRAYTCPEEYAHAPAADRVDWLNAHYFDYRGLIPMGLALEAPEGMYKSE